MHVSRLTWIKLSTDVHAHCSAAKGEHADHALSQEYSSRFFALKSIMRGASTCASRITLAGKSIVPSCFTHLRVKIYIYFMVNYSRCRHVLHRSQPFTDVDAQSSGP